jgi:hypothetical protein
VTNKKFDSRPRSSAALDASIYCPRRWPRLPQCASKSPPAIGLQLAPIRRRTSRLRVAAAQPAKGRRLRIRDFTLNRSLRDIAAGNQKRAAFSDARDREP